MQEDQSICDVFLDNSSWSKEISSVHEYIFLIKDKTVQYHLTPYYRLSYES